VAQSIRAATRPIGSIKAEANALQKSTVNHVGIWRTANAIAKKHREVMGPKSNNRNNSLLSQILLTKLV
jgi:hypothetical protein